jgi:hypothetical protein
MKNSLLFLSVSLLVASPVFAQDDLVPATSEDIRNFDSQVPQISPVINPPAVTSTPRESESSDSIEAAHGPDHQSGNGRGRGRGRGGDREGRREDRRENFGAVVAAEAKILNDSPKGDRPKREDGISGHRRRDDDRKIPGDASTVASGPGMSSTMGGSSDARSSAPKPEDDSRSQGIEDGPDGIEDRPEESDRRSGRNRGGSNRPRRDR